MKLLTWTDAPIKCSTFLVRFWGVLWDILATRMKPLPNSSDLSLGRRPEFESDEFGKGFILVVEILRCEKNSVSIHTYPLSEHESTEASRHDQTGRIWDAGGFGCALPSMKPPLT